MNWRRGFTRLWCLFAVLWAASFAVIGFAAWRSQGPVHVYEVTTPEGVKYNVEGVRDETQDQIVSYVKTYSESHPVPRDCAPPLPPGFTLDKQTPPPQWCSDPIVLNMPPRSRAFSAWDYVLPGLGVPVALLTLGVSLVWVMSGFRDASQAMKVKAKK